MQQVVLILFKKQYHLIQLKDGPYNLVVQHDGLKTDWFKDLVGAVEGSQNSHVNYCFSYRMQPIMKFKDSFAWRANMPKLNRNLCFSLKCSFISLFY